MKTFKVLKDLLCDEFNAEQYAAPVDRMNNPSNNAISEAQKQIAEETEKARIDEAKKQLIIDEYSKSYNALKARHNKKLVNIDIEHLKLQTEENQQYAAGNVDTATHRKRLAEIADKRVSAIDKQTRAYDQEKMDLNKLYPEGRRLCANHGIYFD